MSTKYVLDLDELGTPVRETGTGETIFICPYCPPGDPDQKGHLYVNRVKGVGECKRCLTVIVVKEGRSSLTQKFFNFMAAKAEGKGGEDISTGIRMSEFRKTASSMGFRPINKHFTHEYLNSRYITGEVAEEASVFFNPTTHELMFPFLNPFTLDTFSGWSIRKTGAGGWVNTKAAKKNLYLPSKTVATSKYLIVVEGIADALSLYARGYPATSIGGTTITPLQIKQLMRRAPEHIDLLLDKDAQAAGLSIANSLSVAARNSGQDCKVVFAECPVKDPAEMTWEDLVDVLGGDFEPPLGTNYRNFTIKLSDLEEQAKPKGNGIDRERGYL